MNAEILCVGTEILLGDIVNSNAAYLAKELALCGVNCYYQTAVGDNPERLQQCLEAALSRADMVVTTGGLGPTYDDLTKETVAAYFGRNMVLHEDLLAHIRCLFARFGRPMTPSNEKQAWMPEGAIIFPNDRGTAPGLAVEGGGKIAILLPGPPREMTAMFDLQVRPYLASKSNRALVSHTIHLFGIGESTVEDMLHETMCKSQNPTVAPYAKEGELHLRVTASGGTAEEADALTRPMVEEICAQLAQYVYGVDVLSLQNALVQTLRQKNLRVATAESCTAGYLSKRLSEVAGVSQVFDCGVTTYSNEMKTKLLEVPEETLRQYSAVSSETALAMAQGVRKLCGAEIGLAITGIAGPGGGTPEKPVGTVYVAVSSGKLEKVTPLQLGRGYGEERELIRYISCSHALHLGLAAAKLY